MNAPNDGTDTTREEQRSPALGTRQNWLRMPPSGSPGCSDRSSLCRDGCHAGLMMAVRLAATDTCYGPGTVLSTGDAVLLS